MCAQLDVVVEFLERDGLGIYSQTQYLGRSKVALFFPVVLLILHDGKCLAGKLAAARRAQT